MPGQEIKKELTALENLKLDIEQYERMQDGVQELNGHVRTLKASFTTLLSRALDIDTEAKLSEALQRVSEEA